MPILRAPFWHQYHIECQKSLSKFSSIGSCDSPFSETPKSRFVLLFCNWSSKGESDKLLQGNDIMDSFSFDPFFSHSYERQQTNQPISYVIWPCLWPFHTRSMYPLLVGWILASTPHFSSPRAIWQKGWKRGYKRKDSYYLASPSIDLMSDYTGDESYSRNDSDQLKMVRERYFEEK